MHVYDVPEAHELILRSISVYKEYVEGLLFEDHKGKNLFTFAGYFPQETEREKITCYERSLSILFCTS